MDLKKQFNLVNDIENKIFKFNAKNNKTTSYTVAYYECEGNETNAWIVLYKAIKKDCKTVLK